MNDIRDYKRRLKQHEKRMKRSEKQRKIDRHYSRHQGGMASRKAYTIGFLFVAAVVAGAYSYEQHGRYWIYDFMQWECVDCKVKDSLDQALNKPWTDDLLGQDQDSSLCQPGNPNVDYADVTEFIDTSTAAVDHTYQVLQAHAEAPKSKSELRSKADTSISRYNRLLEKYNSRIADHCFHGSEGAERTKLVVQLKKQHSSMLGKLNKLF